MPENDAVEGAVWYPRTTTDQEKWLVNHPMLGKYRFPTPPLLEACNLSSSIVGLRAPCCSFIGPPRFGKTRTAEYLGRCLAETMPRVHVLNILGERESSTSTRGFLNRLNIHTGGAEISRSRDPMTVLTRRWIAEATKRGADQIVMIADELGRMTVKELISLADITNIIDAEGLALTTVSFGSVDMNSLTNMLYEENRLDLIARFFSQQYTFNGIESASTLRSILECFDDPAYCFPPNSSCCFTQFFLPQQYLNGFRLSTLAKLVWEEFMRLAGNKKVVGAQYVFHMAQIFLNRGRCVERLEESRIQELIDMAIKLCGYEAYVRNVEIKGSQ